MDNHHYAVSLLFYPLNKQRLFSPVYVVLSSVVVFLVLYYADACIV